MHTPPHPASTRALVALFGAVAMLTACGGGDDPPSASAPASSPTPAPSPAPTPAPSPAPSPAPTPAPAADFAFATPNSTTDTAEAGKLSTYAFAEKGNEQTPAALQFASGAVSYGATLTAAQAFAGVAVRAYAPGNTGADPTTPLDATAYHQLKIQLKSSTDALLQIKLQPSPVAADGCTATAQAVVSATLNELVIDLDDASFPLPDYCGGKGSAVAAVKSGLFAVDVINPATTAGAHDLAVGSVKLSK